MVGHINYRLRGEDSDLDAQLVESYCKAQEIPFRSYVLTEQEVKDLKKGNLQEKARTLRYKWFRGLLDQEKCEYLCIAHHQDDVMETYLLHALRASGLRGMKSIQPKSAKIRRPLLFTTKEKIKEYVSQHALPYRTDGSNKDSTYDRNFLRNDVVNMLKERWPQTSKSIYTSARNLSKEHQLLTDLVDEQLRPFISWQDDIMSIGPLSRFVEVTTQVSTLLFYGIHEFGFNKGQIDDVILRKDTSGKTWFSSSYLMTIKDDHIMICPRTEADILVVMDEPGKYSFPKGQLNLSIVGDKKSDTTESIEYLDYSKVKWPLTCRIWEHGDHMIPLGMLGKKKLISDILIDRKVNVLEKMDQLVLLDVDKEIIWLINHRLSETVKYTNQSDRYLKLEWIQQ